MPSPRPDRLAASAAPTTAAPGLVVRLRNWVGDVTLSLPLLQRLAGAGVSLQLVGRPWAADLLAGHGWPVHALPPRVRDRVGLLRGLRTASALSVDGRRIDALCLPDSLSSALEFRLAGLRAMGHAGEGRSWLLARALARPRGEHHVRVCWRWGDRLLGRVEPLPARIALRPSAEQVAAATALRRRHGLQDGFVVVCPFAGGTWDGLDKTWPAFPAFAAALRAAGRRVVLCPGPGEEAVARTGYAGCTVLEGVKLGTYAALLAQAAAMVANDTGPGHMAAAVGTPLVSVLGPSDAALWHAWGPDVTVVQNPTGWPSAEAVDAALRQALARRRD